MTLVLLPPSTDAPARPGRPATGAATEAPSGRSHAPERMAGARGEGRGTRVAAHAVLLLLSLAAAVPILWMYLTSLRPPNEVLSAGPLSSHFGLGNYRAVISQLDLGRLLSNTAAMAVAVSLGELVSGLLAAYAFARWSFRGSKLIFLLIVATFLVPFQVTMLPNYVELSHLGLLDSLPGVILPQLASALAILLLRQHLRAFPKDLLDAARVDGQSSFVTLWRVVVPNLAPALAALAILLFVQQWNEYFWPLLVYRQPVSVLQLGIQSFLSLQATDYGGLMAASGLACLPIFALYLVLQRRVVNAFVRSGLR